MNTGDPPDIGYGYPPGGPLVWGDWDNSMDSSDFVPGFYEPVGELATELQNQRPASNDFNIPRPVPGMPLAQGLDQAAPSVARDLQHAPQDAPVRSSSSNTKRKADTDPEPESASSAAPAASIENIGTTASQPDSGSRSPSVESPSRPAPQVQPAPTNANRDQPSGSTGSSSTAKPTADGPPPEKRQKVDRPSNDAPATGPRHSNGGARGRRIVEAPKDCGPVLPAGKVFPIQIGPELFRLSGASISSDAPSYFSQYFGDQLRFAGTAGNVRTLYIDRDPMTFRDIALHLQGYYVTPRDSTHFVKLFADAQFYSLPRLSQQLFKNEIIIKIGLEEFQIPRDLFSSPGDAPNFFSLGCAHFFSTPTEVFPGLDRQTLLRPPPILPPTVPHRSGETFKELMHFMQGYPVRVRDEGHRADLLRDARYYHFKGLEQRLLPVEISYNSIRNRNEVTIRLEDIRQSGVSFRHEEQEGEGTDSSRFRQASNAGTPGSSTSMGGGAQPPTGYIQYARPFVDETPSELIIETSGESAHLDVSSMRVDFTGQTRARVASLLQVIASKLNLPATVPLGLMLLTSGGGVAAQPVSPANSGLSGETVRVLVGSDAWVEVDGRSIAWNNSDDVVVSPDRARKDTSSSAGSREPVEDGPDVQMNAVEGNTPPALLRTMLRASHGISEWILRRAQWRLRVEYAGESAKAGGAGLEVVLCAVRIEAITGERARNRTRGFLGAG